MIDYKLLSLLKRAVEKEIDTLTDEFMAKFEKEIVEYEDPDDPARPSLCRDEFRQFIKDTLEKNIQIVNDGIEIGVGDNEKLGFGERLDEETTDCLKIIGTILQGINGEYVLVTSDMTGGPEGRFGGAFLMPLDEYRREAPIKGWNIDKPIWRFSNFKGIPDFFKIDISNVMERITKNFMEMLAK